MDYRARGVFWRAEYSHPVWQDARVMRNGAEPILRYGFTSEVTSEESVVGGGGRKRGVEREREGNNRARVREIVTRSASSLLVGRKVRISICVLG